ncbi:hypothetical protein EV714DRAFT_183934, partial [Schizophyllum commune]
MPPIEALRHRTRDAISSVSNNKLALYAVLSVFATAGCIVNGARNHSNFYSVMIYLSRSSASVLIFANFGLLLAVFCGHLVQLIFFGPLRAVEVERLYDRTWYFITESLLSFTIFRDEFDASFAVMFCFLVFVKAFHWLASDRIEWMDQRPYPGPPLLFHIRMSLLFMILWLTDTIMLLIAVESNLANGVSCMVLFACEYGVLLSSCFSTVSKYMLSVYDFRRASVRGGENAPPWEHKSVLTFYIELATDFLKLATYSVFFVVIMMFYGVPLNIIRDVFMTGRSFFMRLRALHRYRTATRNMDERYPNATAEELEAMSDRTCIICREEMVQQPAPNEQGPNPPEGPNQTPKKLPCGHIFHFYCLRSWLERQQSCPTCRRTVLETTPQGQAPQNGAARPANQPGNAAGGANAPAGNAAGQAGANQRMNNINNAARFVGGLFGGGAARPAGAPAAPQPAQTQAPQQPQNNRIHVQHLPAGGLVVQYHIHYGPGGQQGTGTPTVTTSRPPLQDVQPLEGFMGPNGVWQPWPNLTNEAPTTRAPTSPTSPTAGSETSQGSASTSTSTATPSQGSETEISAREAARAAFLRRMNAGGPTGTSDGTAAEASASTATGSAAATATASASATSTTAPTAPTPTPTATTSPAPLQVPLLVPAVDEIEIRRAPPSAARMSGGGLDGRLGRMPNGGLARMTDEELARMDRLTREAIDERLRVLESVSQTVYGCVDELMRLRSSLPARATPPPQA